MMYVMMPFTINDDKDSNDDDYYIYNNYDITDCL